MDEDETEQGDDDMLGLLTLGIPLGDDNQKTHIKKCSKCGRRFESQNDSCPYCGTSQRDSTTR